MAVEERYLDLTAKIVTAYVSNNTILAADLADLIAAVHVALSGDLPQKKLSKNGVCKPAVPVGKSIFEEYLICLEDGQKFKSLKRHLRAKYDMSPDEYRQKWGLAASYPMVAPEYAKKRSALAVQTGLGRKRKIK